MLEDCYPAWQPKQKVRKKDSVNKKKKKNKKKKRKKTDGCDLLT